jgi:hypothetical protein
MRRHDWKTKVSHVTPGRQHDEQHLPMLCLTVTMEGTPPHSTSTVVVWPDDSELRCVTWLVGWVHDLIGEMSPNGGCIWRRFAECDRRR